MATELKDVISTILPILNEKQRRIYLASQALLIGHGGIKQVSEASGISDKTISRGIQEYKSGDLGTSPISPGQIRQEGGGRKSLIEKDPALLDALLRLVDGDTYGNPMNPLRWTTKSLRHIEGELKKSGFKISYKSVGNILEEQGFSLQQNQKMNQVGKGHIDRDAQFKFINDSVLRALSEGVPAIYVDCKKKELVGNFKNSGVEYSKSGHPVKVCDHDWEDKELGKAAPFGIYDLGYNEGYVNVGVSSDTAEFAVASIRAWWREMGQDRFPGAGKLLITCDGGGSNGSRNRLWKKELQNLADELNLEISVTHFPPGTSKWNKIEHRLFSQITKNWRGRPLETLEIIVSLIAATTTESGLVVKCGLDKTIYETGIKVTDEEMADINLFRSEFHGDWNYTIKPKVKTEG